ncbi:SRPBCC family protein [Streptomyces sp. NPDC018031]|uniref:SRPBCC family protein n=1 Tax=Streptomyces sp. NPDC018031 TaxID=3365033 RepID=UPI00379CAF9E
MAVRHVLVRRSPEAVWAVLSDGERYAEWVVGTERSHQLDGWPAVGAALRWSVRIGPWRLRGDTVVRRCEPPTELQLEARSGSLGSARIAIEVLPWGEDALLIVDEHPLSGPGSRWHNGVVDALLQLRHRAMLRRLAGLIERSAPPGARATSGGGPGRVAEGDTGPW